MNSGGRREPGIVPDEGGDAIWGASLVVSHDHRRAHISGFAARLRSAVFPDMGQPCGGDANAATGKIKARAVRSAALMASLAIQPEMNAARTAPALALYVHWPFCVSKCPYCDFNSHVRASIDQEDWRDALLPTWPMRRSLLPGTSAELDLLRRRHAVADGAGDGRGDHRRRDHWRGRRRSGDHPGSQSEQRRSRALRRSGPRPASTASASASKASTTSARLPRPRPLGRRGLRRSTPPSPPFERVSFDLIYALPGRHRAEGWSANLTARSASAPSIFRSTS